GKKRQGSQRRSNVAGLFSGKSYGKLYLARYKGGHLGSREKPVGKPFEKPYFLFDLYNDPQETTNLIADFPDIAGQLLQQYEKIRLSGRSR
ncbi:hypothetical protein JW935_25475, partial [candidate division KSB1 bacterium]|nr:hypothetical protein [candidate division KSB1 bacterium]